MIEDYGNGPGMRNVPCTDDQLPLVSRVGRGIKGDDYRVDVIEDGEAETHLQGRWYDHATKSWTIDWTSGNVNAGMMLYEYNLRPYTRPQTFTISFKYLRPGRTGWAWTTPAIPYVLDESEGVVDYEDFVGINCDTLFVKNVSENWMTESQLDTKTPHTLDEAAHTQEKLLYPAGWSRSDMNAPLPGEKGSVNLTYGPGGDIDVPDWDAIAKIIGFGIDGNDLIQWVLYDDGGLFDGYDTIQEYIDAKLNAIAAKNANTLADIVNKVYGGGTIASNGHVTWGYGNDNSKIPLGNLNIFAGIDNPSGTDFDNAIRSRGITVNDLKFE